MKVVCIDDQRYPEDSFDPSKFIKKGLYYNVVREFVTSIWNGGFFTSVILAETGPKIYFRRSRFRPLGDENKMVLPSSNDNEKQIELKKAA